MKGIFITLEGPDGSGKSTIIKFLSDYLETSGVEYIVTREPGGTDIGEEIRKIILDEKNKKMSPVTEALLYAASRGQHVHEKILPALEEGKVVLCERFVLSSLAYQGIARGLGIEKVKEINDFAIQGVNPDITLFFSVDPGLSLGRKIGENKGDRLEKEGIGFHREVYEGYLKLIKMYPEVVKVIDASKSVEQTFAAAKGEVEKILKERGVLR